MKLFKKLKNIITKKDKKNLVFLLIFTIFVSSIEVIGISVIMPFITIATNFEVIHTNEYYIFAYEFFSFSSEVDFIVTIGILLFLFYFLRSGINLLYHHKLAKFANNKYHFLAFSLLENYLGMEYKKFVNSNIGHLTKVIVSEAGYMTSFITSSLMLISELFVTIFIYIMLLYVNVKLTLVVTFILLLNGIFLTLTISKKIKKEGVKRELFQKKFFQILSSSLGNFKFIKLKSNDVLILKQFEKESLGFVKTNIMNQSLQFFPRYILEAVGFGLLVSIITIYIYLNNTDIATYFPIITIYVLALYRLLPSVSRMLNGYNEIMFTKSSLDVIHNELLYDIEELGEKKLEFKDKLVLRDIKFAFSESKSIFKKLNLVINKGDKIAFIGESGSGKSTLVDMIMGLYKPQDGIILVDNVNLSNNNIKSFRSKIGYIPQDIYLFDGSIAENISFGSVYDETKILDVLRKVNLEKFIMEGDGILTNVGDNGSKLSGGQKQRVGIARALYSNPEILILDEATSALDKETESKIMDEIYNISKDMTLIVIAHRLSTIDRCEKVYTMSEGILYEERR